MKRHQRPEAVWVGGLGRPGRRKKKPLRPTQAPAPHTRRWSRVRQETQRVRGRYPHPLLKEGAQVARHAAPEAGSRVGGWLGQAQLPEEAAALETHPSRSAPHETATHTAPGLWGRMTSYLGSFFQERVRVRTSDTEGLTLCVRGRYPHQPALGMRIPGSP